MRVFIDGQPVGEKHISWPYDSYPSINKSNGFFLFASARADYRLKAPARVKRTMTANGFDRLPVGDGGRDIRACLKAAGHTKVTKSSRASCASTVGGQRCLVAITGATAPSAQLEFRIRDAVKKTKGAARAAVVFRGPGGAGWRTKFLQ